MAIFVALQEGNHKEVERLLNEPNCDVNALVRKYFFNYQISD